MGKVIGFPSIDLSEKTDKLLLQYTDNIETFQQTLTKWRTKIIFEKFGTLHLVIKALAHSLVLSEKTIEFHLKNLLAKLQVNSRVEATLWAKAHGLISDG